MTLTSTIVAPEAGDIQVLGDDARHHRPKQAHRFRPPRHIHKVLAVVKEGFREPDQLHVLERGLEVHQSRTGTTYRLSRDSRRSGQTVAAPASGRSSSPSECPCWRRRAYDRARTAAVPTPLVRPSSSRGRGRHPCRCTSDQSPDRQPEVQPAATRCFQRRPRTGDSRRPVLLVEFASASIRVSTRSIQVTFPASPCPSGRRL